MRAGPLPRNREREQEWTGAYYAGFRAWIKYIGVKMPSRPASAIATAHRFKVSATRAVPRGATWSTSSTFSELSVAQRPIVDLRKPARERPEPTRG